MNSEKPKYLTGNGWKFHKEFIDSQDIWQWDIGVGEDASSETGLSKKEIADSVKQYIVDIVPNNGVLFIAIKGIVMCVIRRDKCIDVGTRKDAEGLGWGDIFNAIDERKQS